MGLPQKPVLLMMGVSGTGKTTVAQALAAALRVPVQEGDMLHPPANIAKMHAAIPLTDADRLPWLHRVAAEIDRLLRAGKGGVITCSALKRAYRDVLRHGRIGMRLVYLHADPVVLKARMLARIGHFMPASLLDSQLRTLEPPTADENPITVESSQTVDRIVAQIMAALDINFENDHN